MLRVLDLFSGIGGFSLGLERTGGFRTVAFCEIDPFCQRVLAKHWPGVPCHDDVRTMPRVAADVVCAGFPCQDISYAGSGWQRFRDSFARAIPSIQSKSDFQDHRSRARARMANPSELYGGAYESASGMDRNRSIGNSIYWQIPELIGRAILEAEAA